MDLNFAIFCWVRACFFLTVFIFKCNLSCSHCGTLFRVVHAGCLRLRKSSQGDGNIKGEGKRYFVDTGNIRHGWQSGIWSAGWQTVAGLTLYLKHCDHHGRSTDVSCFSHLLVRVDLRIRRVLQRFHWSVMFMFRCSISHLRSFSRPNVAVNYTTILHLFISNLFLVVYF